MQLCLGTNAKGDISFRSSFIFQISPYAKSLINFTFNDDRRVLPYESVATKHCLDYHVRGGPSSDGSYRLCCFLEVSTNAECLFPNTMREILEQSLNGRFIAKKNISGMKRPDTIKEKRERERERKREKDL
ncbi:hypothetical protein V1477_003972 [Vespula maculifrons]|uniref:Uncharacterized protein n=1 Tax=Vespula maculifrons TaxID=7453 RepID=A0ABD2CSG4_VESMC